MKELALFAVMVLQAGCCPGEKPPPPAPPDAAPLPTVIASTPPGPRGPYPWPLPQECYPATECVIPDAGPGVQCAPGNPCFNPCPTGMAPEKGGSYCARTCRSDKDCSNKGRCVAGLCDRWPPSPACENAAFCQLPGGATGLRCKDSEPCRNPCKPGHVLFGGTHCAKPCRSNADCPGGECTTGVCGPLCPSEGCPYRWE